MVVHIYALLDPVTGKPCYVGSSKDVEKRIQEHWWQVRKNPEFSAWINSLDKYPEFVILESVPPEQRFEAEHRHTEQLRSTPGIELLNRNSGSHLSPSHRERLTAGQKAWQTGRKHSAETKAKMSATRQGHEVSSETRAKISTSQKARWAKRREES